MGSGRGCGGWSCIEPSLQRAFSAYGRFLLKRGTTISWSVALIFAAVGFYGLAVLEREEDRPTVWLSSRGRILGEKAYFEDRFEDQSPNQIAFIIEPREPGANLLAPERVVAVLDEVRDLQEWIRTFEYTHVRDNYNLTVTLENICFKPVDLKDTEPCFQYSILDCFAEGGVFAPGGERNTEFADLYSARPSYSTFDFREDFTEDYVRQRCVQWFNLGTADRMLLGSPKTTSNSRGEPTIAGVEALRVVFGTKPIERLAGDGLVHVTFTPDEGGDSCLVSSDCPRCVEELGLSNAAQAGCVPAAVAQTDSCCEFMTALRAAPCVEELFVAKPQVENLGNLVFQACGIPTLELNRRCANQLAIAGTPQLCACADSPDSISCDTAIRAFVEASGQADGGGKRRLREAAGAVESRALLQQEASDEGNLIGNETQAASEAPADATPAVCVCLADAFSNECATASVAFAGANPEFVPIFVAASQGDEEAMAQVTQTLLHDAGCPTVCMCLGDISSLECTNAGAAFVVANPEYEGAFVDATLGNETAGEEFREILVNDVGCLVTVDDAQTEVDAAVGNDILGNATAGNTASIVDPAASTTAGNATVVDTASGHSSFGNTTDSATADVDATADNSTDGGVAEVCVCLSDRESSECSAAGVAYITANPDARDTFLAASGGDESARAEVAQILITDAGCPALCTCLGNSPSPQCSGAASDFLATNSDALPTFVAAQSGDAAAVARVRDILISDVGCPVPASTNVPDVCVCLADSNSPECTEAGAAYAGAHPDAALIFVDASQGNETARAQVGQILVSDAGCPAVCACLANSSSPSCTAASGAQFSGSGTLAIFTAAANGNASAVAKVQDILINEIGCPAPLSVPFETIGVCTADPESAECSSAVLSLFMAATNDSSAKVEVAQVVSRSLVSGIECPVLEAAAPPQDADAPTKGTGNRSVQATAGTEERQRFLASTSRTTLKNGYEAWSIVVGWEHAWRDVIGEKVKDYSTIKVSWFSSTSPADILEDKKFKWWLLMVVGNLLVLTYVVLYFGVGLRMRHSMLSVLQPGPLRAIECMLALYDAGLGAFGIIGLMSLTDLKTSPITLQVVPLLMMSLGIKDLFVLAMTMRVILERSPTSTLGEVMAETMAKGGTSITLSSLINALAFGLGALSPVPEVEWFSIQMMVGVIVSYIFSMTLIPEILSSAAKQHLAGNTDPFQRCILLAHWVSTAFKSGTQPSDFESRRDGAADQSRAAAAREVHRAPTLTQGIFDSMLYKRTVLAVYICLLGFSIWGIMRLDRGLKESTTVPNNSNEYKFLKASEDHFSTYPVYMVFREEDFSVLSVFNDSRRVEFDFVEQAHNVDRGYKATSFMEYYTQYTESKVCSNTVCLDEVEWYWDGFSSEEFASEADRMKNVCLGLPAGQTCEAMCREYCPQGPLGSPFRCHLSTDGEACYCPWRPKLRQDLFYENPEGFPGSIKSFWTDFLNNTPGGGLSRNLIDLDGETTERNSFGKPIGARSLTFVEDVPAISDMIKHLRSGRKAVDSAPVEAFPFNFAVYGIGEQYENIRENMLVAIAVIIALAAMFMMLLTVHWFTGALVSLCVVSAVAIGTGMVHWVGLSLNYTVYVSLIVSVGLSVEFCAHIARDFMLTPGERSHRACKALKHMGMAVFNGGVTTILFLLPLAWSGYSYFKNYFFVQYSMVTAVGLLVGLFLLPVLLAMFGPDAFQDTEQSQTLTARADDSSKEPTEVGVDDSGCKAEEMDTSNV